MKKVYEDYQISKDIAQSLINKSFQKDIIQTLRG